MNLLKAVKTGDLCLVEKLLQCDPPAFHGYNILHEAIARGKKDIAKYLIGKYPDLVLGHDFPYGNTPLMYAISSLDLEMIELFDDTEAFSIPNEFSRLPLQMSISTKDIDIIKHVYERFPRALEMQCDHGQYALHLACQHGCNVDIVSLLYSYDQDVPDEYGNYPMHLFGEFTSDDSNDTISYLIKKIPASLKNKTNPEILRCTIYRCCFRRQRQCCSKAS